MKHSKRASLEGIGLQFFAMGNLDAIQQKRTDILQRMTEAVQANDREKFTQAFSALADAVGESILGDVRALRDAQDENILAARGCRVLTSQERQYYEAVIGAMKSDDPKQALTNINKVLPETVIDAVFEDLVTSHPLLAEIDFRNTGALVKILLSTTGGAAKGGPLGKTITAELSANFIELDLSLASLTAFLPVNRYMLDLGPAWLDRYVRELLSEALAVELETARPAGRLLDLDVIGIDGEKLSRGTPRACLVCGGPAGPCARSRAHGLSAVREATESLLRDFAVSRLGELAVEALIFEVDLTPKPGLVDRRNSGAHRDMDRAMFHRSARALESYFRQAVLLGMERSDCMPALQAAGLAAEETMLAATGGVNTHKGAIFSMGILACAAGWSVLYAAVSLAAIKNQDI